MEPVVAIVVFVAAFFVGLIVGEWNTFRNLRDTSIDELKSVFNEWDVIIAYRNILSRKEYWEKAWEKQNKCYQQKYEKLNAIRKILDR